MTDHDTGGTLDGCGDELSDWTEDDRVRDQAGYCDSGNCLHVETDGDSTVLYESAQPDIRVVTSTASWQAQLDQAKAEERAAIVAWLRTIDYRQQLTAHDAGWWFADLIETLIFDDVAAGDE